MGQSINKELGTDAVVSVFLTLSLRPMEKAKLFQNNPFMVQFYGGYIFNQVSQAKRLDVMTL